MAMRIFSALDLAVVGGGVAAYAGFLAVADLTPHVAFAFDADWLPLAVAVASSHVLYALVWFAPRRFTSACARPPLSLLGAHAVSVFSALVFWFKLAQQCALLLAYAGRTPADALAAIRAASQAQLLLAAALLCGGQVLNASIYRAIGQDGVYYGFKLGRPVPWCTDFPFNVGFRHPQYVGGVLSQLGVIVVLTAPATLERGLVQTLVWWLLCYAATSWMEAVGDNNVSKKKRK